MKNEYNNPEIYITENGCAFDDVVLPDGRIVDEQRINYFKSHIKAVNKAILEGTNIKGYFAWSLMDNFEWALGYSKRFGIIYVDYQTQKRTFKESANWYKELIKKT
jgi:beta-glucosidase